MTNQNNKQLTLEQILEIEAKVAADRAAANVYAKAAREARAALESQQLSIEDVKDHVQETEIPKREEDATEVTEVPEQKEEEVPPEETETPEQEEEVAPVVTEVPEQKKEEVPSEETETPEQEEEVSPEETETPEQEEEVPSEETETPKQEEDVTTEVTEAHKQEDVSEEEKEPKPKKKKAKKTKESKDSGVLLPILVAFAIVLLAGSLIMACLPLNRADEQVPPADTDVPVDTTVPIVEPDQPVDTDAPVVEPEDPVEPVEPEQAFNMTAFKHSVANIAAQLTEDEDVTANTNIFVENIGEDKLVEFIGKHGELNVQKAIAEMLVFVPDIKVQQYVVKNDLDYNPNAAHDYDLTLQAADAVYRAKTGKNPDGALMSLEGYDTYKSNREAIKALIVEAGDIALLEWYTAKTEGYDLMIQQNKDTDQTENYRDEVKLELVNSAGAIKLLELQLEKETDGTLTVMDNVSMQYTAEYAQFILNNYMYVVAI